jgi:hypothetical protein
VLLRQLPEAKEILFKRVHRMKARMDREKPPGASDRADKTSSKKTK